MKLFLLNVFISSFLLINLFSTTIQFASALGYTVDGFCTGGTHACAIIDNSQAKCWGLMRGWGASTVSYDYLGKTSTEVGNGIPYIDFGTSLTVSSIYCGGTHTCAKLSTGVLKCVGMNDKGQIGLGVTTSYIGAASSQTGNNLPTVSLGAGLSPLGAALGKSHTCIKVTGDFVKCFGANNYGQLGIGSTSTIGRSSGDMGDTLAYTSLGTDVTVASIHTGPASDHSCIILLTPSSDADRIKCWGYNTYLQLGYGGSYMNQQGDAANEMGDSLPLVDLGTESRVKQLALGGGHTCALLFNDNLKCWGDADFGQVSSGSTTDVTTTGDNMPVVALDSGKVVKWLTTGSKHTCIVYDDSLSMKCIGQGSSGQLAQGNSNTLGDSSSEKFSNIPAIQLGGLTIRTVYAGNSFNCVIFTDDSVKCFGDNTSGQLAIGVGGLIGDSPTELGTGLPFANFNENPTKSPTKNPTKSPVPPTPPSEAPTKSPTPPTKTPTKNPSKNPTKAPTKNPTKNPSTKTPTLSPTVEVSAIKDKHFIRFDQGFLNRTEAEVACENLYGTHLATFTSNSDLYQVIISVHSKDFWIGLNDIDEEGVYVWASNSSTTYKKWDDSSSNPQPNNADDEDCVVVSYNSKWSDVPCSNKYDVLVCDVPQTNMPTMPTPTPTFSPSKNPTTSVPTVSPSVSPTKSSINPTNVPTKSPTTQTNLPTSKPVTSMPTSQTNLPTKSPTDSTAASTNKNDNTSIAVGLGVSIPLITVAAAGLFFFKYRSKKSISNMIPDTLANSQMSLMGNEKIIEMVEKKRRF